MLDLEDANSSPTAARWYQSVRSAQLERQVATRPVWFLFDRVHYDLDASVLEQSEYARHVTRRAGYAFVLTADIHVLEVNEPMAVRMWPRFLAIFLILRFRRVIGKRRVKLVAYCIENYPLVDKVTGFLPFSVPPRVLRVGIRYFFRWIVRGFDQLAFGTAAAESEYAATLGTSAVRGPSIRRFEALPAKPPNAPKPGLYPASSPQVLFLGALDERKGIRLLIEAWPIVAKGRLDASLLILGKGPFAEEVSHWAQEQDRVEFREDPPRAIVHQSLDSASVLCLLSQRTPLWREQIGLPILEGLAAGLEIVTTSETGIATWLAGHGHAVLDPGATSEVVAHAILKAIAGRRPKSELLALLPELDGRIEAEQWLLGAV